MKGVQPGPLIFQQNGQVVYAIYAAMALSSLFMLIVMFIGMKGFVRILKIPSHLLLPLVFVLCTVGAFGINNRLFDCYALIFFGFVGYLLQKGDYPMPPLILGFVLGSIMELNLRRALSYSQGDITEFFTLPYVLCIPSTGCALSGNQHLRDLQVQKERKGSVCNLILAHNEFTPYKN